MTIRWSSSSEKYLPCDLNTLPPVVAWNGTKRTRAKRSSRSKIDIQKGIKRYGKISFVWGGLSQKQSRTPKLPVGFYLDRTILHCLSILSTYKFVTVDTVTFQLSEEFPRIP